MNFELTISTVFDAPGEKVWQLLTDPVLILESYCGGRNRNKVIHLAYC